MKIKLYGALLVGTLALGAQAQQQPAENTSANSSDRNLPPGLERREQLPPGLERRETLPPGLEKRQQQETPGDTDSQPETARTGTNDSFSKGWNRAGTNMARFGTNAYLGASNAWTSLSNRFRARTQEAEPTSDRGSTNRVYATNNASATSTSTTTVRQDQAVTAADRKLLVNIRQEVQPILVNIGSSADVHFISRQGIVTIVGLVPSVQESRRIVESVQRVPGVTRVVNQIQISNQAGANVGTTTVVRQDQAVTPADQRLLVTIREEVQPVLVTPSANVYFRAQQGVVTVMGVVPSQEESQRVIELVQRTPGVVRVINQIQVNAQTDVNVGAGGGTATSETGSGSQSASATTNQVQSTNTLSVTGTNRSSSQLGSTAITNTNTLSAGSGTITNTNTLSAGTGTNLNTSTNLTPTGRTNTSERNDQDSAAQEESLPPGLRKRETLPPGLEKRDQLPPGLQKREQDSK